MSYFRGSEIRFVLFSVKVSSNDVITFGLTQPWAPPRPLHCDCVLRRRPGSCYRRSSATNPSFLWGWLGMVMVASLKRTLFLSSAAQSKVSGSMLGTTLPTFVSGLQVEYVDGCWWWPLLLLLLLLLRLFFRLPRPRRNVPPEGAAAD